MQKLKLLLLTSFIFLSTSIFAANNKIGIELINSSAKHNLDPTNKDLDHKGNGQSFSLSYGYDFGNSISDLLLLEFEAFFDNLSSESKDINEGVVNLDYRVGMGLNLGFKPADPIALFLSISAASVRYEVNWPTNIYDKANSNYTEIKPIYGVGIYYNFTKNLALRARYDFQNDLKIDPPSMIYKYDTQLETVKVGLAFKF